jgi:hypothetical protein
MVGERRKIICQCQFSDREVGYCILDRESPSHWYVERGREREEGRGERGEGRGERGEILSLTRLNGIFMYLITTNIILLCE